MLSDFSSNNDTQKVAPHILSIHISPCPAGFRPLPFGLKYHIIDERFRLSCLAMSNKPQLTQGTDTVCLARCRKILGPTLYTVGPRWSKDVSGRLRPTAGPQVPQTQLPLLGRCGCRALSDYQWIASVACQRLLMNSTRAVKCGFK